MPAHSELTSLLERHLLAQLGERLKRARTDRGTSVSQLARELGISRTTIYSVEAGDPSVTVGSYVRILGALGLVSDLALVASPHELPKTRPSRRPDFIAQRLANLDLDVVKGRRSPESLFAVPREMARAARVSFPKDAFGVPEEW